MASSHSGYNNRPYTYRTRSYRSNVRFLLQRGRRPYMALRTMPVAARVICNRRVPTRRVLATRNLAAEGRRAAALDRAHHLHLRMAEMAAVGVTPSGTVAAEDARDLQCGTAHGRRRLLWCALPRPQRREPVERTHHVTQHFAGNVRIARGRIELGMSQRS